MTAAGPLSPLTLEQYRAKLEARGLVLDPASHERHLLGNVVAPSTPAEREAPAVTDTIQGRPGALPVLYLSLDVLQGLDVYTTARNLARGSEELNPLVRPVAGNPWAMTAVKSVSTAASIYVAERLWRKHRVAAVALTVASNVLIGAVVAQNATDPAR